MRNSGETSSSVNSLVNLISLKLLPKQRESKGQGTDCGEGELD